jgi:hypothetical protein
MGYTTDFAGSFEFDRPLAPEHKAYLDRFAETRRMLRDAIKTAARPDPVRIAAGLDVGPGGAYFVGADDFHGQEHSEDILDYNQPPQGQPSLWCQWVPTDEGTAIVWDEGEKFYHYVEWLEYLVKHFLGPWGYKLNGRVSWQGEEGEDSGDIYVRDNKVKVISDERLRKETDWDD